jgi:branched-chain amino acid transport system permease protein
MAEIGELLVSAFASGCIYGLMALSYLLIIRPTGVINFALGEWAMLGAFAAVALGGDLLLPVLELPHFVSLILVVAAIGLLGALTEILTRPTAD